jgi:hypothetical protein
MEVWRWAVRLRIEPNHLLEASFKDADGETEGSAAELLRTNLDK